MEKLLLVLKWSTFALSLASTFLAVGSDSLESLEVPTESLQKLEQESTKIDFNRHEELVPLVNPGLYGGQRFSPRDLHQEQQWNVEEQQALVDKVPPKGQMHSQIDWASQDPQDFLSISRWMEERSFKDKDPDWKLHFRELSQKELVGKVLNCGGSCEIFRGINKAKVEHLSQIREGDEFVTGSDSGAWIFLMDGSLVRISAASSVTFLEINWSSREVFHLIRLNQGHMYWHPRSTKLPQLDTNPETDSFSLPLLVRSANQEHFERQLFQLATDKERNFAVLVPEEQAIKDQIQAFSKMREKNDELKLPPARAMLVSPNATLMVKQKSLDFFFFPGGKSYFKARTESDNSEGALELQLRGYKNTEANLITQNGWSQVEKTGREFGPLNEVEGGFQIVELLTKRIRTIELAREIWLEKFSAPIVKDLSKAKDLAFNHGYILWDENLEKRISFLNEYMKRMETTNIRSIENLMEKGDKEGKELRLAMNDIYYRASLENYLQGLKKRLTPSRQQVREMSDVQYYIWILRHGRR